LEALGTPFRGSAFGKGLPLGIDKCFCPWSVDLPLAYGKYGTVNALAFDLWDYDRIGIHGQHANCLRKPAEASKDSVALRKGDTSLGDAGNPPLCRIETS
jgi:hypothetical protein